nr:hypothetical protein [Piscirickettsia salmonis]
MRAAQNNQGSGADVAASVYGGVHYQPQLSFTHTQHMAYSLNLFRV